MEKVVDKICSKCGITKCLTEFYNQKDGLYGVRGDCKQCFGIVVRNYNKNNRAKINKRTNRWRLKNRVRLSKVYKDRAKKYINNNHKIKYKKDKKKQWSVGQLNQAIIRGDIDRQTVCTCCGSKNRKIQAHHPDYSKPLDVIWLCSSCHGFLHSYISNICALQNKEKHPEKTS